MVREPIGCGGLVPRPRDAVWRHGPGSQPPPEDWASPRFDDSAWRSGESGFGYAGRDDATVLGDMESRHTTLCVRHRITVENPAAVEELVIAVDHDDGYALYLNGRLAVSQNAPETITYRSVAEDDHDAGDIEEFRVPAEFLVTGANAIAAVGRNRAIDSSDFSLRIMVQAFSAQSSIVAARSLIIEGPSWARGQSCGAGAAGPALSSRRANSNRIREDFRFEVASPPLEPPERGGRDGMKTSKFTEAQIAMALRPGEAGTPVEEIGRKLGISEGT